MLHQERRSGATFLTGWVLTIDWIQLQDSAHVQYVRADQLQDGDVPQTCVTMATERERNVTGEDFKQDLCVCGPTVVPCSHYWNHSALVSGYWEEDAAVRSVLPTQRGHITHSLRAKS